MNLGKSQLHFFLSESESLLLELDDEDEEDEEDELLDEELFFCASEAALVFFSDLDGLAAFTVALAALASVLTI